MTMRWVFVLLALPLLLAFPYVRALGNPNELVRVYTVIAIVENGTYHIDEQVDLFGHTDDMAYVHDHYVMVKAPGIVHLGVAPYVVFSKLVAPLLGWHYPRGEQATEQQRLDWLRRSTWFLRMTTSQLPCLLFLWWLERYLRAFSADAVLRWAAVAAVGLGSNVLAYAHMFASHTVYAVVAFVAFATIEQELRAPTSQPRRALFVGFLTSACVTLEYQSLFMTVVLSAFALWTFRRPKAVAAFALGGALNVPLVMWFHHCAYGNAFTPGHKLLENPQFAAEHRSGLWGISWPSAHAIHALATDPGFGFFGLSPFMWLGLAAIPVLLWLGSRHVKIVTAAWAGCMAAVFFVNAGFVEWRAGWTVGARYLVVCVPFFAFGALVLLERVAAESETRRALARGTAIGLAFAGVVAVGTVGVLVDTLPDQIGRPFAQFFVPMLRAGFVAHDLGEPLGLGRLVWYVTCAALLCAPLALLALRTKKGAPRVLASPFACAAFVSAAALGLAPAFTAPCDGTALFVLHPSTIWFAQQWEPQR